jgi:hypothetical protein
MLDDQHRSLSQYIRLRGDDVHRCVLFQQRYKFMISSPPLYHGHVTVRNLWYSEGDSAKRSIGLFFDRGSSNPRPQFRVESTVDEWLSPAISVTSGRWEIGRNQQEGDVDVGWATNKA